MIWSQGGGFGGLPNRIISEREGFPDLDRRVSKKGRTIMKKISDRGESKGMLAVVMVAGLWFGLIAVFDHISMLQNHWMGSW